MNLGRRSEMYILRPFFSFGDRRPELDKGDYSRNMVEIADEYGGTLNRSILVGDILDLTQFDTLTPELDLAILSATVQNVAVGAVYGDIACSVEGFSRDEGVGNKGLLSLFGLIEISTGELNSTNKQLSDIDRDASFRRGCTGGCWGGGGQLHRKGMCP